MSTHVCWCPRDTPARRFTSGTSTSLDRVCRALGAALSEAHIPALRAMAIAAEDSFYAEIADVIERVGPIKIWGET